MSHLLANARCRKCGREVVPTPGSNLRESVLVLSTQSTLPSICPEPGLVNRSSLTNISRQKGKSECFRTELAFRTSLPAAEQSSLFPITTVLAPPPPLFPLVLEGALPQFAYCTAVILFACEFGQAKRIFFPARPTK